MKRRVDEVEFRADHAEAVVARMEGIQTRRDGWVNIQPGIDPADEPPPPGVFAAVFGASTFPVPVGTWVPGRPGIRGLPPDTIGLQHANGPKAVRLLAERGVAVPGDWQVKQDNRRGLVIELAPDTAAADILDWLLRAAGALTAIPVTGDWRAEFHTVDPDPGPGRPGRTEAR